MSCMEQVYFAMPYMKIFEFVYAFAIVMFVLSLFVNELIQNRCINFESSMPKWKTITLLSIVFKS